MSECGEQLLGMAYGSIRRRVADTLLRLHEQAGATPEGLIQLSRDDMAAVVGTARVSLIRTLSEFKQSHLVEPSTHVIKLLRPERLRQPNW